MSEQDEFQEIGPRANNVAAEFGISIRYGKDAGGFLNSYARLTMRAIRSIALAETRFISVAVSPNGRVRIRPATETNHETPTLGVDGNVPRIASYCKEHGYREGRYDIEVRDGALYFQLERQAEEAA